MKVDGIFSLTDYFSYYFAGFWWLACFFLILSPNIPLDQMAVNLTGLNENLVLVVGGVLIIVVPYFIGFTMAPIAEALTGILIRTFGDPKKAISRNEKHNRKFARIFWNRNLLSESVLDKSVIEINKLFGVKLVIGSEKLDNWNEVLFSYVSEYGNSNGGRLNRLRNLASLTESILIPLPLFLLLLASRQVVLPWWVLTSSGILAFLLLMYRYFVLRKNVAMQIYRSMLVLAINKK